MGVFQDLLNNAKTFKSGSPLAQYVQSLINRQVDPAAGSAAAAATDAVHTLAVSTQTSGTFTLTFTLRNGETFTTGALTYDDIVGDIETAIDVAATAASITGWTNGDISVSGGAVDANPVVFTFDGDSVSGINHPVTVLNDVDGAGGAWGSVSITTDGQSLRRALDVMLALGVLDSGTIKPQADAASTTAWVIGPNWGKVPGNIVRDLFRELAEEDVNNDTYHAFCESLPIDDRARKAAYLGGSSVV